MAPTSEQIRAVAQAIIDELTRQDYGNTIQLGDDLKVDYLDQGEVDLSKVALAAIAAMEKVS